MSAERRLTRLEGALTPRAATLLWLAEAHTFPTLLAYVAWLVDQPLSAAPLYRVPQAAQAGVRAVLRGEPRHTVERAARGRAQEAVFLVELVLRLNTTAEQATGLLGLRSAALDWEMRAISAEAQLEAAGTSRRGRDTVTARWAAWRGRVAGLLVDLYLVEEIRAQLERRHLDGRSSLFPDLAADWQLLRGQAERLAETGAVARAATPGASGARRGQNRLATGAAIDLTQLRAVARDRAPAEASALMDAARAAALDALGDVDGAARIVASRLRAH